MKKWFKHFALMAMVALCAMLFFGLDAAAYIDPSVGGTLTVGGSGTIAWTGARLAPGDYPLATASDIVLEPGAGWQASPSPGSSIAMTALSVQDNGNGTKTLLFRVISGGTLIIFR